MTETGSCTVKIYRNYSEIVTHSVGFLSPSNQLKIVDEETGKTLGSNAAGEICMKTATMMLEYYKNPEETKKAFDSDGIYIFLFLQFN